MFTSGLSFAFEQIPFEFNEPGDYITDRERERAGDGDSMKDGDAFLIE